MAFPVLAAVIGAGIGALYTKASGGSNRDMLKNMVLGAGLGTIGGYAFPQTLGSAEMARQAALGQAAGPLASGQGGLAANLKGLSTASKVGLGGTALALAGTPPPPKQMTPEDQFKEGDYKAAYEEQREKIKGLGDRFDYAVDRPESMQDIYDYSASNPLYKFSEGGIAEIPRYAEGGVNYLPSKLDHDEKDKTNYVRASGYIEDATEMADKDKDTMLAQLADGEFVSRADAVLGAGIMSGANPSNFKEMRKEGAKFFYKQQDQLKRIYDMVS